MKNKKLAITLLWKYGTRVWIGQYTFQQHIYEGFITPQHTVHLKISRISLDRFYPKDIFIFLAGHFETLDMDPFAT